MSDKRTGKVYIIGRHLALALFSKLAPTKVEMPCILKIKIVAARNLPIMDRATDLTDAFVEIKFSDYEIYKTQTQRRSLNPVWNEDFRFEVSEDSVLQNEPLELKILDYDQITYHDSIGIVLVDLNPLLTWDTNAQISGWFPIYDTLLGVRGELNAQIKLQFFGDINPFKDSSAGVQFFSSKSIPVTHQIIAVLGFVSSIDNEDDPEYHWADNFRTPRKSNEARTRVMFKLSGQIRRQVGKKVLELNGNAVIGYKQYFDLESEKRAITARAIGTAVKLVPIQYPEGFGNGDDWGHVSPASSSSLVKESISISPALSRSFPKSPGIEPAKSIVDSPVSSLDDTFGARKYSDPMLITLNCLPSNAIIKTGGLVSATSIKLIDNDERAVREAWWAELREEIKAHARTLLCAFIIGYTESTSINEELAVLNCSGTAVCLDLSSVIYPALTLARGSRFSSLDINLSRDNEAAPSEPILALVKSPIAETLPEAESSSKKEIDMAKKQSRKCYKRFPECQMCHISYPRKDSPFPMALYRCLSCKKHNVPEILLTTIELPKELKTVGEGRLIEAHVCRQKKIRVGDTRAIYVSESVPFCQYDIHRQLTHKLRIYGMNAIFALSIKFNIGDSLMTAVATGTAVYVRCLPPPPPFKVSRNLDVIDEEDKQLLELQKAMMMQSEFNRNLIKKKLEEVEAFEAIVSEQVDKAAEINNGPADDSDSDSSLSDSDNENERALRKTLRSSAVVQIDDEQDEDLVLLIEPNFRDGFSLCNTEYPPIWGPEATAAGSYNIQMLTILRQSNINEISHHPNRQFAGIFKSMYQDLQIQISYFHPKCIVSGIKYDIHLPKDNFVQISLTAVAMGLVQAVEEDEYVIADPGEVFSKRQSGFFQSIGFQNNNSGFDFPIFSSFRQQTNPSLLDNYEAEASVSMASLYDDMEVFQIEEDDLDASISEYRNADERGNGFTSHQQALASKNVPQIEITTSSFIPQATIRGFLGRISLHFVKETTISYDSGTGKDGMGGLTHAFLVEMYAIARSHAVALGGNAVVSFSLDQVTVLESIRNQAYMLVSLSADVVSVEYETINLNSQTKFAERLFGKSD